MQADRPEPISVHRLDIQEMMFYQYYPFKKPGQALPEVLEARMRHTGVREMIDAAESDFAPRVGDHYIPEYWGYLTIKHGWATTENPLNRPGWHVDAWGHFEDMNYVWCDRFPTVYVLGDIGDVPDDDALALKCFETAGQSMDHHEVEPNVLYRFGQDVVHSTPEINNPGYRSFVKISFSPHQYNLRGNSINYGMTYPKGWTWVDRDSVRNDPVGGNKDFA